MSYKHRIAAGGFVFDAGRVLLVRYASRGASFLVAPGGAIEDGETLSAAAEREIAEETGVQAKARRLILLDNIRATSFQMIKAWYLCDHIEGHPWLTPGAKEEGIVEVRWFCESELTHEVVFPEIIKSMTIRGISSYAHGVIETEVRHAAF